MARNASFPWSRSGSSLAVDQVIKNNVNMFCNTTLTMIKFMQFSNAADTINTERLDMEATAPLIKLH